MRAPAIAAGQHYCTAIHLVRAAYHIGRLAEIPGKLIQTLLHRSFIVRVEYTPYPEVSHLEYRGIQRILEKTRRSESPDIRHPEYRGFERESVGG